MWNKCLQWLHDSGTKRLLCALCVSILVHALLFGGVDLSLPFLKKDMHVIEARLQMPKATVKKEEPPKPEPEAIKPKSEKPPKQKKQPAPKIEKAPELPPPEIPEPNNPAPKPSAEAPIESPLPPVAEKIEPEVAQEEQAVDAGLVINENAYRYVETYFDVHTKIDGPTEGSAKIVYNLIDANHYEVSFLVKAEGLAGLVIPDWLQKSDGMLTKKGLQPSHYLYQFGDKPEKTRSVIFDWQANTLQTTNNSGVSTEPLLEGTQDQLSFMYQFMYVEPLQKMQINITNGKKLREYDYQFEGEELVISKLGEVKTVHIAHKGEDSNERKDLWLATEYQHVPVKIVVTEKNGKIYEFVATRIVTNPPVNN